ncbi:MAG: hypothetical protein J6I48_02265 [Lachnospira sp.]|nr:hypothetical protein [Lachnospira sp.]
MKHNKEHEIIVNEWQTCVQMANALCQRRDEMNNRFCVLNTAIIGFNITVCNKNTWIIILIGLVTCIVWIFLIVNYKILKVEKYKVIKDLEMNMPLKPFCREWIYLNRSKRYIESTKIEIVMPIVFILLYLSVFVMFIKNIIL